MRSVIALLSLAIASGVQAAVLYSTAPSDPELAFASDSVPGQFNNQRLAEAFVLGDDSTLSSVRWWGRSEGSFFPDLRNMVSFTVQVYADAGAIPGTQVFSSTVPVASANPVVIGTDSSNRNLYVFDFAFTGGLALEQGTYWLSVGTQNADPDGDGFFWQASQQSISGTFAADSGVNGSWNTSGFADLALEVNGEPVPEPATLAALAGGVAVLLRRGRRG
jgi:hypothetical protein